MSLTVFGIGHCQILIKNSKGDVVGVIDGRDTLHAIPISESRLLHEFAVRKVYLDSMVFIRESEILNLEARVRMLTREYESLLDNSGDTAEQLRKQIQITRDELDELKKELRRLKRKLFWANARTIGVAVLGAVIVWLTAR